MENILDEFHDQDAGYLKVRRIIVLLILVLAACLWTLIVTYYRNIGFPGIEFTDFVNYISPIITILLFGGVYFIYKNKQLGWWILTLFHALFFGASSGSIVSILVGTRHMIPLWRFILLSIFSLSSLLVIIFLFHKKFTKVLRVQSGIKIVNLVFCVLLFLLFFSAS